MKNIDKWVQTIYEIDKNGDLVPNKESLKSSSYVPRILICEAMNKIGKKYLNGKMLDLGCGNIPFYAWYKDSVDECICTDWADTLHKNENLDVVADISNDLPFSDEEFDSILSAQVLEHIYNPFHMFKECHRILKKGGYFMVSTNFSYWEHETPYDYLRHTQYFLKRIAEETGFSIVELETEGDGLCVLADVVAKIQKRKKKSIKFYILNKILKAFFYQYHVKQKKIVLPQQPIAYMAVMRKL